MKIRNILSAALAAVLLLSIVPFAFADEVPNIHSGESSSLAQGEEMDTNYGFLDENWGTVATNNGCGVTPESDGEGIAVNYWRVGENNGSISVNYGEEYDASQGLYSCAEVYTNNGTVFTNLGNIYDNSGSVSSNEFLVMNNNPSGTITDNCGDLAEVNLNNGCVVNNGSGGIVDLNGFKGVVENNSSYVGINYGTVTNAAGGTVEMNLGVLIDNGIPLFGVGYLTDESACMYDLHDSSFNSGFPSGTVITLRDVAVQKDGCAFRGWRCDADGCLYQPGENFTVGSQPALFTAQWENISADL